jgi:hypothetical protein
VPSMSDNTPTSSVVVGDAESGSDARYRHR